MKKTILGIIIAVSLFCPGCSSDTKSVETETIQETTSMFVELETSVSWKVVYHKDSKVMYVVSDGMYNHGNFTVLVNADGTPMIYGEDY